MLERYEVLRYVRKRARSVWRQAFKGGRKTFFEKALGLDRLDPPVVLDAKHLTVTFSSGKAPPHEPLVKALQADDKGALKIARALKLPSLDFEEADLIAAVDELIDAQEPSKLVEITVDEEHDWAFDTSEISTLDHLVKTLLDNRQPLVQWSASFDSGARFLASCIRSNPRAAMAYQRVICITPSDPKHAFNAELEDLAILLDIEEGDGDEGQILFDALRKHQILLIIGGIEPLQDPQVMPNATVIRRLIKAAKGARNLRAPAPLLFVGKVDPDGDIAAYGIDAEIGDALAVSTLERSAFFEAQWVRNCKLRAVDPAGEIGSRLKRAQWHYDDLRPRTVLPINIRVRAFFASNLENYAFFDPTAGFTALAGTVNIPRDIQFFVEDVEHHLKSLARGTRQSEFRLLRLLSTAKYWLTPETLTVLAKSVRRKLKITDKFLSGISSVEQPIVVIKPLSDPISDDVIGQSEQIEVKHYVLSMGVKAIVQDEWQGLKNLTPGGGEGSNERRLERSTAHFTVAKRLFLKRNNGETLSREFPLDPHWGRHRIHFVSEALRHLVRSIDGARPEQSFPADSSGLEAEFVKKPDNELGCCNPNTVINFCFETLYRKELNRDFDAPWQNRQLTRLHGAYVLAMELLQLMGRPGEFGVPHWALDQKHHRRFTLEAGYAALNVGRFDLADRSFQRLVDQAIASGAYAAEIDGLLRLSLSHLAQDKLDVAEATILQTTSRLKDAQVNGLPAERLASYHKRVHRRQAHLLYLRKGNCAEALEAFEGIFGAGSTLPELDKPELLIIYIDLLEWCRSNAPRQSKKFPDALGICTAAMFRAMSAGYHHEAMVYKIAFARLLRGREMLSAAEAVLDGVHADIIDHGCSERTYLAFLLEAGTTLIKDNRAIRAFTTYLRACIERASARGFQRERQDAIQLSLEGLAASFDRALRDPLAWEAYLSEQAEAEKQYRSKDVPDKVGPFARDPLSGYSISGARSEDEIRTFDANRIATIIGDLDIAAK